MRTFLLAAALLVSTQAFADPPLTTAEMIRLEEEISVHLVELDTSFATVVASGNQLALLHAALDAKATALRVLAARCATTCSAADRAAMGTAAQDLAQTQTAGTQNRLQVQVVIQRESQLFSTIAGILRTKHGSVKNSIAN